MLTKSGAKTVCTGALWLLAGFSVATPGFAQNAATSGSQSAKHAKVKPTIRAAAAGELRVSRHHAVSPDVVINLINLMVENKMIKQEQADALIKQAQDEAYVSRQATKEAAMKAAQATAAASAAEAAATPPGTKRVVYVPEVVKKQIRDELKREVLRTAQAEHWASPGEYPEWASRIRFSGDFRMRTEGILYPKGNATGDQLPNFNAINTGSPYDLSQTNLTPYPSYDTNADRDEVRLQARLAMDANLFDGFTTGIRIATGSDSQPVSTNQTLGASGGNFSKYELWLDRAFLNYDPWGVQPWGDLNVSLGRFANPFFSATDLVWYHDLGFDGAAVQARRHITNTAFTPFIVAGAFPTFNTDLNFGTTNFVKTSSEDRYLIGGQIGTAWAINPHVNALFGVAYYDFTNIQGQLSQPCEVVSASSVCSTDDMRPSFAQNGNTYMALRDIIPDQFNSSGQLIDQYQYFGLASAFREVDVSGRVDFSYFAPIDIILDGEFVDNTGFNSSAVGAVAVNNLSGTSSAGQVGSFDGGNIGWMTRLTVGHEELKQFGDWNVNVGYKYLESDAVVDAFADADFGLGGTNLKGYLLGANLALTSNVWTSIRWLSSDSIAGAPYDVDVLMVDLNAKY
jgi:hypothetical protein